jgi:hypothetical protein
MVFQVHSSRTSNGTSSIRAQKPVEVAKMMKAGRPCVKSRFRLMRRCLVIGSDTAPVREVLNQGANGHLVSPFDTQAVATKSLVAMQTPPHPASVLRHQALRTAQAGYRISSGIAAMASICFTDNKVLETRHAA